MKQILVPCDFSQPAINAYHQALNIAQKSSGAVHLLYVVDEHLPKENANNNETYLSKIENQFKSLIDGNKFENIECKFDIRHGAISDIIQEYIRENNIDLVIMGSTGASGLKEVFIGSNAEKVVRQSQVPVLIVKNYYGQPIRKIVFPNTLEHQEDLVTKVKELQDLFKAKLCLVYINTQFGLASKSSIHDHLQQFVARYMLKNYSISVYDHLSIEKGIIEFTKMINGDLIALGTHGHEGLVHLVKGSIAEDIVNHAERPIWTYRMKQLSEK